MVGETVWFLTAGCNPQVLIGHVTRMGETACGVKVDDASPQVVPYFAIVPPVEVSSQCDRVIALMEDEYELSSLYDGCVTVDFIAAKMNWSFYYAAYIVGELIRQRRVERRDCDAFAVELPVSRRLEIAK
jgi:hypothetical protein